MWPFFCPNKQVASKSQRILSPVPGPPWSGLASPWRSQFVQEQGLCCWHVLSPPPPEAGCHLRFVI